MTTATLPKSFSGVRAPAAERTRSVLPPVIVLGGGANALSIARSLAREGVEVYALNEREAYVRHSKHCRWIELDARRPWIEAARDYLLGPESDRLAGAVLLAAADAGIELIAQHRTVLAEKFLLDDSNPQAQTCMLNKLSTYRAATAAGVPTPRYWLAHSAAQVQSLRDELVYPLIVKPQLSHLFEERFGRKFIVVENFEELLAALDDVLAAGIEVLLVEKIPGPDSLLMSYYTYLDARGEPQFDFTKRIIRRFPANMGAACYHVTDCNPEVRDVALRLFQAVGLRGVANAEFKRDPRDGQLKLIECNARFTAANGLLADSGVDLSLFVYNRVVGRPIPNMRRYRVGRRLWYPVDDFKAFRELRRRGELTLFRWIGSLLHRQTFPFFRWTDPLPTCVAELRRVKRLVRRIGTG